MRTYAPASTEAVLERLLEEPSLARGVIHHEVLPPARRSSRRSRTGSIPDPGRPASRGISELYTHQGRDRCRPRRAGRGRRHADGVRQVAVLRGARPAGDHRGRRVPGALPVPDQGPRPGPGRRADGATKAAGLEVAAATYDGDTPAPIRSAIRPPAGSSSPTRTCSTRRSCPTTRSGSSCSSSQGHRRRRAHTYRGVFGSHVANVLRRLLRICAHYGSRPVIVCCSATIGNLQELAEPHRPRDAARRPERAPAGERHVLLVDPPPRPVDRGARLRADACRALGTPVPAGRPPDDRLRSRTHLGRDHPVPAARGTARELRAAQPRAGLPRRVPADRAPLDRAGPARRRGARRRQHQRAGARRGHRAPRRRRPGGLPGFHRRRLAAARGPAGGRGPASAS